MDQEHRRKHCNHDGLKTQDDLHVASSTGERTISYVSEGSYHSDHKLENLQWQVKEMELEARSRRQRRSLEGSSHDDDSGSSYIGRSLHQSHSRLSRDRLDITNEREGWVPKCCHECHDPSIKEDRPITLF